MGKPLSKIWILCIGSCIGVIKLSFPFSIMDHVKSQQSPSRIDRFVSLCTDSTGFLSERFLI